MISSYRLNKKSLSKTDDFRIGEFLHVFRPTREEIGHLSEHFDFPFDYLGGILDDHENARFEVDDEGNLLILMQFPSLSDNGTIETYPYSLVLTKNQTVIFSLNHEYDSLNILNRSYHKEHLAHEVINQILSDLTHAFHSYLRRFRFQKRELERELRKSVDNELIISMIGMNTSLIYFEDALQNNREVLEQVIDFLKVKGQDSFSDKIYDIFVETDQAFSETKIQLKLLENMRDLFSNIVGNNLNTIMKIMTSATFVLGIPAAIAGIYGMNVPIPEQTQNWAFFAILGGTAVFCGFVVYLLRKKNML